MTQVQKVEGPWHFTVGGKVKIGTTVPTSTVSFMDRAVESGFFANRSDFVTQSMIYMISSLNGMKWGPYDEMLKLRITEFSTQRNLRKWHPQAATKDKKIKIGITVPPLPLLFMDEAVSNEHFANRSDFVSKAMEQFIEYLSKIGLERVPDVGDFYGFLFEE